MLRNRIKKSLQTTCYKTEDNVILPYKNYNIKCKKNITKNEIETIVFSARELYILSILGYIDKLILNKELDIKNVKNYVSSSFGTIASVYLAFDYTPKHILSIFFENIKLRGDILFKFNENYGIFDISDFIDELLKPLSIKIGYIPTLREIYKLTNKRCIFITHNLTKNKTILLNHYTYPDEKINELIKICCIIPLFFKKYNNTVTSDNFYIDYSFIDCLELDYSNKIFPNSSTCNFKIYTKNYNTNYDVKNMNIAEYIKYLFDIILQKKFEEYPNCTFYNNKIIEIKIDMYNLPSILDFTQKYKEYIKLYCKGFDFKITESLDFNDSIVNDEEFINKTEEEYNGLVLCGGGSNSFYTLGILKNAFNNNILNINNIRVLIGTSAGSILAMCLSIGMSIEDIIDSHTLVNFSEKMSNFENINIIDRINEKSVYSNETLLKSFESIFLKYNNGEIPTLLDIKTRYNKELVYVTYNLTKNQIEYLNYKNSPDLLITHACVMSCCIPLIFNPFEYKKDFYIDGGIFSNYSLEITKEYKEFNFMGICINIQTYYQEMNLFEYISNFFLENFKKTQKRKISISKNCKSYVLNITYNEEKDIREIICIDKKKSMKMFEKGYEFMEKNYKN